MQRREILYPRKETVYYQNDFVFRPFLSSLFYLMLHKLLKAFSYGFFFYQTFIQFSLRILFFYYCLSFPCNSNTRLVYSSKTALEYYNKKQTRHHHNRDHPTTRHTTQPSSPITSHYMTTISAWYKLTLEKPNKVKRGFFLYFFGFY